MNGIWLAIAVVIFTAMMVLVTSPAWSADDCRVLYANKTWEFCTPTPVPTETPTEAPTAAPTATNTPEPSPTPTQTPVPALTIPADGKITQPGTYTGSFTCPQPNNNWSRCIEIDASNVTLDGVTVSGGGIAIGWDNWPVPNDDITIRNSLISGYYGNPLFFWGTSERVTIEGNTILNTRNVVSGIMGVRGDEGSNPCPAVARHLTFRDNEADQNTNGWFGVELKCAEDVTITGNTLKGGQVLISLPDNNRVLIADNFLDMRPQTTYWGIEVPKAHDVSIRNNVFQGDPNEAHGGSGTGACGVCGHAVSTNSGPLRLVMEDNEIRDLRTVLDTTGDHITVRGNVCTNVMRLFEYEHASPFVNRVVSGNQGCDVTPPGTGSAGIK